MTEMFTIKSGMTQAGLLLTPHNHSVFETLPSTTRNREGIRPVAVLVQMRKSNISFDRARGRFAVKSSSSNLNLTDLTHPSKFIRFRGKLWENLEEREDFEWRLVIVWSVQR